MGSQKLQLSTNRDGQVEIRGTIGEDDAEKFERALDGGVTRVRIRSPGGLLAESLRIGRALRAHHLELEVLGLCASACALLILPGAEVAHIDDGSIIAMRAAAEGAFRSAMRENRFAAFPERAREAVFTQYQMFSDELILYFNEVGVNETALSFMYNLTSTSDVHATYLEQPLGKFEIKLEGRKDPLCRV